MRNLATPEALLARWQEVLGDPTLCDLPYKIELNSWGKVEMTPASNRHGRLQAVLALELGLQAFGEITPFTRAPEICVEILSPANVEAEVVEKTAAYLAAGADEVWLVSEDGAVRFVGRSGEQQVSRFPITLSLPARLKSRP